MALSLSVQTAIAFKNLQGRSHTYDLAGLNNEPNGIFFNITSKELWMSEIDTNASLTTLMGNAIFVTASLVSDITSAGQSYFAKWPVTPPSGTDRITNLPYAYNTGVLTGINAGDTIKNGISPAFGPSYNAMPRDTSNNIISPGDSREWVFQYNSGIFYQEKITYPTPSTITYYVYAGETLDDIDLTGSGNSVRISAFGTDSYTASMPSPTYSSEYIYLVDFEYANTGPSTLNIDGMGTYSIESWGTNSFVSLTASQIQPSIIYYLVWDGYRFQLYQSSPESNLGKYTNLIPTTQDIGGVTTGTVFNQTPIPQVFDMLFHPELVPNFTSFGINGLSQRIEVGNSIPATTLDFIWSTTNNSYISSNSIEIIDVSSGNIILASSQSNTGTYSHTFGATISYSVPTQHTFKISALRNSGTYMTKNAIYDWEFKTYYGTSTYSTLTGYDVSLLTPTYSEVSVFTYPEQPGYKYFCVEENYPPLNLIKDNISGIQIAMAGTAQGYTNSYGLYYHDLVQVVNLYGITASYRVYRTLNELNGSISINIS